jgi:predicted RNA-binding Zn-ribbon protein involved in translation (DUF1610 family)
MSQQTTMTLYQDVVLECQHCYMICRYTDAAVRRNCPACGRAIANWAELDALRREKSLPSHTPASASTGAPSPTPKP